MQELESWKEERRSAYLYQALAGHEAGTTKETLFQELRRAALRQAGMWEEAMRRDGREPPRDYRPDLRARVVAGLLRAFGPRQVCPVLAAMKIRGVSVYTFPSVEGHAVPGRGRGEHRHAAVTSGGNLRAAVFGINDGLVSNAALILGVAGAAATNEVILLAGVAGLLAGAFSMAAGEYVSVRSQREMYEHQIGLEAEELEEYPAEEAQELSLIYQARGMPADEAGALAERLVGDKDRALDTLAREELGLNPEELGSPWGAALSSFVSFALGAVLPLLPYLGGGTESRIVYTVAITAVALFAVGALISLFTGRAAVLSGLRMLAIGGGAGALTYVIGHWLGVGVV